MWGPWPGVKPTGGGGAFPGFGGAPPAIASVSSAGASGLAAQSDHTHALDVVPYNPTLVAMKAAGVLQQTYAAPTATPTLLTMVAGDIPFGATAGGILTQDQRVKINTANMRLGLSTTNPVDFTNVQNNGQITLIREAAGASFLSLGDARASNTMGSFSWKKARGTWAAPAIVAAGDSVSLFQYSGFDGANYITSMATTTYIPTDAAVAAGVVPQMWGVQVANDGPLGALAESALAFKVDSKFNVYAGSPAATNASVDGFFYMPAVAGAAAGVPAQVFGSVRAQNRVPTIIDTAGRRVQVYTGGAWHWVTLNDYTATATRIPFGGAVAGTQTDNAAMTYTVASQTLTLTGTGGLTAAPLVVAVGDISGIGVTLNGGATTIQGSAGLTLRAGNEVSLAPGGGAVVVLADAANNLQLGFANQLAAAANNGFPFIPSIAGPPTGVPVAAYTTPKMVALTFDPATNKLWAYNPTAAAWKSVTLT